MSTAASGRFFQADTDLPVEQPPSAMPISAATQEGSGSALSALMHLWQAQSKLDLKCHRLKRVLESKH